MREKLSSFEKVDIDGTPQTVSQIRNSAPSFRSKPFLIAVVLPTFLVGLYHCFLANDRYLVEAQFVVRTPGGLAGELAGLVNGASSLRASDESYIVNTFIVSRDAARALEEKADILSVLGKGCGDPLWCYPGYIGRHSNEALTKFLRQLVSVSYNSTTGVSTLSVQAFTPSDASKVARVLLDEAERLLNRLNVRPQADAVRLADENVKTGQRRADEALAKLAEFREGAGFIDPLTYGKTIVETITKLAVEAATARAAILELQQSSPLSPQIATLRARISALEEQIELERQLLVGGGDSLASRISDYEKIYLEKEFSERRFISALASAEVARIDANRQRVFLERISPPDPPDRPQYPDRFLLTLASFPLFSALYYVGKALLVGLRQHAGA